MSDPVRNHHMFSIVVSVHSSNNMFSCATISLTSRYDTFGNEIAVATLGKSGSVGRGLVTVSYVWFLFTVGASPLKTNDQFTSIGTVLYFV